MGEGGLTLINGNTDYIHQFAGGVAGTGTFKVTLASGSSNPTYRFTGSVKDWTGSFELANGGKTANIAFENQATEVNAAVTRTAGTLNVEVGNGTDSFSTTFNNTVQASKLTVNNAASATLANTANIGTLSGTGVLTVAATGNTVSINGTENYSGAVNVTSGTLDLTSTVATGNLFVGNGATLKFAGANQQLTVGATSRWPARWMSAALPIARGLP